MPAQPEVSLSPVLSPEACVQPTSGPESRQHDRVPAWGLGCVVSLSAHRGDEKDKDHPWGLHICPHHPAGAVGASHRDPKNTHFSDSSFYWGRVVPFRGGQQHSPPGVGCFEDMQRLATTAPAHGMRAARVPTWATVTPSLPQGKGLLQTDCGGGAQWACWPRDSAVPRWHQRPRGSISSRRRSLAQGTVAAATPSPPVPSVGHNNLKDTIDIWTLYNNIS